MRTQQERLQRLLDRLATAPTDMNPREQVV